MPPFKGEIMDPSLEFLLGMLFMWGAIPFSIGVVIGLWATGKKFPVALLIGMIMIPVFFFGGGYMVADGDQRRAVEVSYQQSQPYQSKPYRPSTAN